MGVSVKHGSTSYGSVSGRNVNEVEAQSLALKGEGERPLGNVVVVPEYDMQGRAELFKLVKNGRFTDIAQMPNLVRRRETLRKSAWVSIVRVCQNGDAH